MGKEHSQWGPKLTRYVSEFDDRLDAALDNYTSASEMTSLAREGLVPLPLLEMALAVGENMHKVGFQHGNNTLPVLMETIRQYSEVQENGIFHYYYGFICIRHLIRMVCIGVMMENESLEDFLNDIDPSMHTFDVTDAVMEDALSLMDQALHTGDLAAVWVLMGCKPDEPTAFPLSGGLDFKDAELLVQLLWKDRRSMLNLCDLGFLPGLPALLFTLCQMTILSPDAHPGKPWVILQDLLVHCYVAATDLERATLRQVSLFVYHRIKQYRCVRDYRVDPEDAEDMIAAYANMFTRLVPIDLDIVMLDISLIVYRHVEDMLSNEQEDLIPVLVKTGLQRLWMAFDRERDGFMADSRRGYVRQYAADIFFSLRHVRGKITNPSGHEAYAMMLLETDIYNLAGRTLLMITRERKDPDTWTPLLNSFYDMTEAMISSDPVDGMLAYEIAIVWQKVYDFLRLHAQKLLPSAVPRHHLLEALDVWRLLGPPSHHEMPEEDLCLNPRCPVLSFPKKFEDVRVICGRCSLAAYCSTRCQKVHWSLKIGSHAHSCRSTDT